MGEEQGPVPHRVQDLALNLTWFKVEVDHETFITPILYPVE
jgi:hypothetical protein